MAIEGRQASGHGGRCCHGGRSGRIVFAGWIDSLSPCQSHRTPMNRRARHW